MSIQDDRTVKTAVQFGNVYNKVTKRRGKATWGPCDQFIPHFQARVQCYNAREICSRGSKQSTPLLGYFSRLGHRATIFYRSSVIAENHLWFTAATTSPHLTVGELYFTIETSRREFLQPRIFLPFFIYSAAGKRRGIRAESFRDRKAAIRDSIRTEWTKPPRLDSVSSEKKHA